MPEIAHELDPEGAILIVRLPDSITHENADDLRVRVAHHTPDRDDAGVVLDAADLRMITSIGVAALLQIREWASDRAVPVAMARTRGEVREFLKMLKLATIFRQFDELDDALDAVRAG